MTTRSMAASLALLLAPFVLPSLLGRASAFEPLFCPKTILYRPRPPRIRYKTTCPKPIGPDCELEHFGYYPTCWTPWPYPPSYSHCPCPPPGQIVPPQPGETAKDQEKLPPPAPMRREATLP